MNSCTGSESIGRDVLGHREVAALMTQIRGRRLQMHRHRIVDLGVDRVRDEILLQLVASFAAHHVEMVHLLDSGFARRAPSRRDRAQVLVEIRRVGDARAGDMVDLAQQMPRDHRLHGVEARIVGEHRHSSRSTSP